MCSLRSSGVSSARSLFGRRHARDNRTMRGLVISAEAQAKRLFDQDIEAGAQEGRKEYGREEPTGERPDLLYS